MFQRDYWSLTEEQLEKYASKYHIPPLARSGPSPENWYFDRDRIIRILVERDNALRTKLTIFLSIAALIVAVFSFVNSCNMAKLSLPVIHVSQDKVLPGPFWDGKRKMWRYFAYNRFLITNRGGRPIALVGVRPHEFMPLIGVASGNKVKVTNPPPFLIFEMNDSLIDIEKDPKIISRYDNVPVERISLINRPIGSGETVILNLGVVVDIYNDMGQSLADQLLFTADLVFADGSKYLLASAYTVGAP